MKGIFFSTNVFYIHIFSIQGWFISLPSYPWCGQHFHPKVFLCFISVCSSPSVTGKQIASVMQSPSALNTFSIFASLMAYLLQRHFILYITISTKKRMRWFRTFQVQQWMAFFILMYACKMWYVFFSGQHKGVLSLSFLSFAWFIYSIFLGFYISSCFIKSVMRIIHGIFTIVYD